MQPAVLLVYGRGGPALEYLLPRLAGRAIVDVLVVGEPQAWQRELIDRLCRRVTEAGPGTALTEEIVRVATAWRSDGVLTFSEYCVVATAEACRRIGVPGPGEGAVLSRNKLLMRQAWERAGVPNPRFQPVDSLDDLRTARKEIDGPLIVKSALGAGSIGQAVLEPGGATDVVWEQLESGQASAASSGMTEHGDVGGPRFIAEQVIESSTQGWYDEPGYGDYLSVEGIVAGGVYHPICLTARLPTVPVFVELSNHAPCTLAPHLQQRIADVCRQAVDALGLDACATHTEVKLMADGTVRLLESAARAGGAAVTRELVEAYDVDLIGLQLQACLGLSVAVPDRLLLPSDARGAAASLSVIAVDSTGRPWSTRPPFVPDRVAWEDLISTGSTVELVSGSSQPIGSAMPEFHPHTGVLAYAGLLLVRAADPLTLRDDCYRILDGLESAMTTAASS
jgi:biotin carboxylase